MSSSGFQIPGLGQAKMNQVLPPPPPPPPTPALEPTAQQPAEPETTTQAKVLEDEPMNLEITSTLGNEGTTGTETAPSAGPIIEGRATEMQTATTVPSDQVEKGPEGGHAGGDIAAQELMKLAPHDTPQQENGDQQVGIPEAVSESMDVDHPESPPSLTHALEAAIGGLDVLPPSTNGTGTELTQELDSTAGADQAHNGEPGSAEWEEDSSPYESSSESSSSDSSSDDDSDDEPYKAMGVEEAARVLMEGGSDDEGDNPGAKTGQAAQLRTKNELPEEIIPRPDVEITQEMKVEELGVIEHIVGSTVLVKAFTPGEYQVLDSGSILCDSDRKVIGVVAETIGKVLQPMYTVYFNSAEEIKELGLETGSKVFYPASHATFVFTQPLKSLKGSDASNLHDEEVGADEMEFSDDEKEAEYKRSLKRKKKDKFKAGTGRDTNGSHPLRQEMQPDGGLNYDDEDGPYRPLTRPPGYGQGAGAANSVDPAPSPSSGSHAPRGRGGDLRGRGGRGRGSSRGGRGSHNASARDGYSMPQQHQQPSLPYNQHLPIAQNPSNSWQNPRNPFQPESNHTPNSAPSLSNFPFPIPSWPQLNGGHQSNSSQQTTPPPPPGWPVQQGQSGSTGNNGNNPAYMDPAILAAVMSQLQKAQNNGQPLPPPPPPGSYN